MKTHIPSLVLLLTGIFAELASGTVIRPTYVPGLSSADSDGASTPVRMVDNSGMMPKIWTGTSFADTMAATHVFNTFADASWQTQDPPPLGGDYFAHAPTNPVLVFDLGRNHVVTGLFFWQLQRNLSSNSWAKDIQVRFAPDPGGGAPIFPLLPSLVVTLDSPPLPLNNTQHRPVGGGPEARFVQLTITDNMGGGPRVGLGEVRVKVSDEPLVELPAETDVSGDLTPRTIPIRLTNTGQTASFRIDSITFAGPDAGQVALDPLDPLFSLPYNVAPGTFVDIPVRLTPVAGPMIASMILVGWDAGDPTKTYELTSSMVGSIIADPYLIVGGSLPLDIGTFPLGVGPQPFSMNILNAGEFKNLIIDGLSVSGAAAARFTLEPVPDHHITIPPGEMTTIGGIFDPVADPGGVSTVFVAEISISSNDGNVPPFTGAFVRASILDDLEISTPPVVTIPPGSSFVINLKNTGSGKDYSLGGAPTIGGGEGFVLLSYPTGVIADSDEIVIQPSDGTIGLYELTIAVVLNDSGGFLSNFVIKLTVKVRNPVELTAHGFEPGGFRVTISNLLPGEIFHLRSSTDLIDWDPIGDSITADGDQLDQWLPVNPSSDPIMFFRFYEGSKP